MQITLNNDEMKEAVKLYIREKCIYHGWEILGVEITSENGDIIGITSLNTIDTLKCAPSPAPCAPSAPPMPGRY